MLKVNRIDGYGLKIYDKTEKRYFIIREGKLKKIEVLELINFLKYCLNEEMGGIFVTEKLAELKERKGIQQTRAFNFEGHEIRDIIKYDIKNNRFKV